MSNLYHLKEVSVNNGENGTPIWIVIKDSVYDVTLYLKEHPGGSELITDWAGRDGTKEYNDFGHSGDANTTLNKYKIGELVEGDRKSNRNKNIPNNNKEKSHQNFEKEGSGLFCCFCC